MEERPGKIILDDIDYKYLHDGKFKKAVDSIRSMIRAEMTIEEIDQAKNYAIEIERKRHQIKYGSDPTFKPEWQVPT